MDGTVAAQDDATVVLEDAWSDEDGTAWKEEDEQERKKIKPS
jgi:hypothetical protein